ncbi:MAG: peptide transporter [Flavobacteriales bacterium]|nr:peptide transporter [Flavobacteriales bacterium]
MNQKLKNIFFSIKIKHPLLNLGFLYLLIGFLFSFFAYFFIPDKSQNANEMILELSHVKPGYNSQILHIYNNSDYIHENKIKSILFGEQKQYDVHAIDSFFHKGDTLFFNKNKSNFFYKINTTEKKFKITKRHFILGSDRFGRDFFSRLVLGFRVSMVIGLFSVLISIFIGVVLGVIAGYYNKFDNFVMWLINVFWSIPTLLLVIVISLVLGKGFWQVFLAIGLTMWVDTARIVRGQVKVIANKEFIESAKSIGASDFRILFFHIIPNLFSLILILSANNFATAVLLESGLSFLGIGVQPPMPSWGGVIRDNFAQITMSNAYLAIFPGVCLMLLILSLIFIGNGLRDKLDIKI